MIGSEGTHNVPLFDSVHLLSSKDVALPVWTHSVVWMPVLYKQKWDLLKDVVKVQLTCKGLSFELVRSKQTVGTL